MTIDEMLEKEDVHFDPEEHKYTGTVSKKEYISVTTLLKKYGLSPSEYAVIPKEILAAKAAYGNEVHDALENFIKGDETQLLVPEVSAFDAWLKENTLSTLDCIAEQQVFNEYYGVAGRVDVQLWNIVGDFKTTASLHLITVMWQLALYTFLLHPNEEDYILHEPKVFWFTATGTLNVKAVPLVPYERVKSMLDAYKAGEETWVDKSVPVSLMEKADEIAKQKRVIDTVKKNLKALENEQEVLREMFEAQMKEESRIYIDAPTAVITLTESSRSTFDRNKVKKLITSTGNKEVDFVNVSTYTRMNIKHKGTLK